MNPKRLTFLFFVSFFFISAQAQFSLRLTEPHRTLKQAMEHYEYGHYTKAKHLAQQYLNQELLKPQREPQGPHDALQEATATFYWHLARIGLKEDGALADLAQFANQTPFASIQQYGYFKLAKALFAQQSFQQAIPFYEKASIHYLSNAEIIERNFELAYCYLLDNQLEKVNPLFASVKDVKGEYFSPGNYYHGVLAYYRGDYDEALQSFEAVKKQAAYEAIVPFYIAELNYFKGNKDKALQQAEDYMKDANATYYNEMSQLAGQIYYEKGEFSKAQNYLSQYVNQQAEVRNGDYFRMGYVKYQIGELQEAITYFSQVKNNGTDLYGQALYFLGLCHLKNGEKDKALVVFKEALRTENLGKLTEDVAFNVAKLSYDLESNAETENRLDRFTKDYPNSKYYSDAIEMLALLNIKTENFEKASTALQKLGKLSPIFEGIYRKVHYARGIQLLMDGKADLAIPYFTESTKYEVNENLIGLAEFWKAECYYRLGQYSNALSAANRFIDKPGEGNSQALVQNAYLTHAYIYMHQNNKPALQTAYINYLDTTNEVSAEVALSQMDSIKPNFVPSHVPFVETNPYIFIYQLPSQQVDFVYTPLPLTPMAYSNIHGNTMRDNFVKVGIGNLRSTHLELGYDLSKDASEDLYLLLSHRASKSSNYLQQASMNSAKIIGKKQLGSLDVDGVLTLERNAYRPYGGMFYDGVTDYKNRFLNFNILANLSPVTSPTEGTTYKATTGLGLYNIHSDGAGWQGSEISFLVDAPFSKKINETTQANIGIEAQVNSLLSDDKRPNGVHSSSFALLKPSVQKTISNIDFEAGLYLAVGQKVHLLPNISATTFLDIIKAKAKVGIESELMANSYKQLSQLNPFIGVVNLQQSKRTLVYGQLMGAVYDNFNYTVKAGGGVVKNLPLFINDTLTNRSFDVWYEEHATIFSLQANLEYHINYRTNAGVQMRYEPILSNKIFTTNYHYVPLQMNAYAKYSYNQRLSLRADLFVRSGTMAYAKEGVNPIDLKGSLDLNLHANYQFSRKWNAFLEVNNILNNQYQRWNNYPTYGQNVLAGFVYSFNKSISDVKFTR